MLCVIFRSASTPKKGYRLNQNTPPMTSHISMKNRTASVEPWERAQPMDAHIGDPPQNLGLRSPHRSKSIYCHAKVKRIAVRFASRAPRSLRTDYFRCPYIRNSLVLSAKIKTHNAQSSFAVIPGLVQQPIGLRLSLKPIFGVRLLHCSCVRSL